jgi:hypothetical protein
MERIKITYKNVLLPIILILVGLSGLYFDFTRHWVSNLKIVNVVEDSLMLIVGPFLLWLNLKK